MGFNPVAQFVFAGNTPEKTLNGLDRALAEMQQRINREFDRIDSEKVTRYAVRRTSTTYKAQPWDMVLCDTGSTQLSVQLPTATFQLTGVRIGVVRASGSAVARVTAPGSLISGADYVDVATPDIVEYVCSGSAWQEAA